MTIPDPKPGGWADHDLLLHTEVNAIRTGLLRAIDGVGGGTYTLGAPLILAGDTLRIDEELEIHAGAELTANGDIHVTSGVTLFCDTGSALDVSDNAIFSGSVVLQGTGVDLISGTPLTIQSLDDLVVDESGTPHALRVPLVPLYSSEDNLGFQENWRFEALATGAWINTNVSPGLLIFMLPVMAGDTLNGVTATVTGDITATNQHGVTDPANKMRLRILEGPASGGSGPYSAIATQVDAATAAGSYDTPHLLSATTGGYTVLDRHYIIELRSENGVGSFANANGLFQLQATVIRNKLVSTNTLGS